MEEALVKDVASLIHRTPVTCRCKAVKKIENLLTRRQAQPSC